MAGSQLSKEKAKESQRRRIRSSSAGFPNSLRVVAVVVVVAGVLLVYLDTPLFLTSFVNWWFGFSGEGEPSDSLLITKGHRHLPPDIPKREAVVDAFKHAWIAYERDAMGDDEYHPISQKGSNLSEAGGIGYTVIDCIDTMLLMGLNEEYARSRAWVAHKLSFDRDGNFNTFETTIRVLGGLLSAYHLSSNDPIYLEKATELADRMLPVFDTTMGLPQPMINLAKREGVLNEDMPFLVSTAEVSTLQLEFRYLSELTDNDTYWRKAENVMRILKAARLPHGLASIHVSLEKGEFVVSAVRLGSRGDSYYEYLLKQYIQTNGSEPVYRDMYSDAMNGIHKALIRQSSERKMTYTAELIPERGRNGDTSWRLTPKQDHLVCFLGGSLMLGATRTGALIYPVSMPPREGELTEQGMRDWRTGVELVRTCMHTHDTATGLSPEIVHFRIPSDGMGNPPAVPSDWYIKGASPGGHPPYDARYMLRPETVESLFLAYRLTGDQRYRDYGWEIFEAIEEHCRIESGGYATVINVDEVPVRHDDKMETFFLSETLKYLFLLFEDSDALPLDKYVFNTEAHPLPIFNPVIQTGFT